VAHGVIQIEEHQLIDPGQHRGHRDQTGQQPGADGVELADMPEGEQPQERARRRGCADPGEQPDHAAVAQQVQIGDRIRAAHHPGADREDLRRGVRGPLRGDLHMLDQESGQPAVLGQRQDRHQPGAGHQIWIVEPRTDRAAGMG
jgi:hypothetical protein